MEPLRLFTWNPLKFDWDYIHDCKGDNHFIWWTAPTKEILPGTPFLFLMQGMGRYNGAVGYGRVHDDITERVCYGRQVEYPLLFECLINPYEMPYPKTNDLLFLFPGANLKPRMSGMKTGLSPDDEHNLMDFIKTSLKGE